MILFYPIPLFSAGGTLFVLECVLEQPYSEQTHKRAWERIQRTIDVHGMIPYEGRHTYLTEMCEARIDMKTMQIIAGHADERMLMRTYVHARPENVVAAGKMIDAYFDGVTGACEQKTRKFCT